MSIVSPLSKIFPKLGFHKRRVAELHPLHSVDPLRKKSLRITDTDHSLVAKGVIDPIELVDGEIRLDVYCTEVPFKKAELVLGGSQLAEELGKSFNVGNRGLNLVDYNPEQGADGSKILQFNAFIFIDTDPQLGGFAGHENKETLRTYDFATEFICAYRGFARAVSAIVTGDLRGLFDPSRVVVSYPLPAKDPNLRKSAYGGQSPFDHASQSDVFRLLCSYKTIRRVMEASARSLGITEEVSPTQWMSAFEHDFRQANGPYQDLAAEYRRNWELDQRVDYERIALKKTWEYLLTCYIE